ncbi:MAG: hypothetical protein K8W52_41525 [Deltaproteobacteria bacterium]|nr:hypothetical protein [Deltaproteobacteria bacterium]
MVLAGCASHAAGDPGDGLSVTGEVVDFATGLPVTGAISVSTRDLSPQPIATIAAPTFVLDGVTPHSVFYALASADDHRATFSAAITVEDAHVDNIEVRAVSEAYLGQLTTAFGLTPTAATGVLFAQAVDDTGHGRAGIPATAFAPIAGARGPYFLGADLAASPAATETSSSGWVVYFEVPPGVVGVTATASAGVAIDMPISPIAAATASVATMHVTDGPPVLPTHVSFAQQVAPIFTRRGCDNCHSGGGPGKDLANLTLDGSQNLIFRELMDTAVTSPARRRVDIAAPEQSLILTMPSAEAPADAHPNVTFTGPTDPDYQTLLVWIREGATQN